MGVATCIVVLIRIATLVVVRKVTLNQSTHEHCKLE